MILVAIGSNLSSRVGSPLATGQAAVREMGARGFSIRAISTWYETAPVPASDQPWYVNGVVRVDSTLSPHALLAVLHINIHIVRLAGESQEQHENKRLVSKVLAHTSCPRCVVWNLEKNQNFIISKLSGDWWSDPS